LKTYLLKTPDEKGDFLQPAPRKEMNAQPFPEKKGVKKVKETKNEKSNKARQRVQGIEGGSRIQLTLCKYSGREGSG